MGLMKIRISIYFSYHICVSPPTRDLSASRKERWERQALNIFPVYTFVESSKSEL